MKVSIKEFDVAMELKNNGVELEVRDPQGNHVGDLVITKTVVEWCAGRTRRGNGVTKSWDDLIASFAP
jgi:hypothetical protein